MSSFFSSDGSFSLQFAIIFIVIFLILAAIVFTFRRLTGKSVTLSSKSGTRGRQPRLGIVDIYELDRQRQLILLRRDNVEHLLLVGGPNDVVIERNINRNMGARLPAEELEQDDSEPETAPTVSYEPKPQPAVPYLEPTFEMPVVVPTPPPGSDMRTSAIARPLDGPIRDTPIMPQRFEPAESGAMAAPEPVPERIPAAAPSRASSRLAGAIRRTPPSIVNLVPGGAAIRARMTGETSPQAEKSEPEIHTEVPAAQTVAPAPLAATSSPRAIDAAILSDMARQLEEALRRPAAAVRPAQAAQVEPEPTPPETSGENIDAVAHHVEEPAALHDEVETHVEAASIDPIAAAMATAQQHPGSFEAQASDGLFDERDPELAAPPESEPVPPPARNEPSPPVFVEPQAPELKAPEAQAPETKAGPEHPAPVAAPEPKPMPASEAAPKPAAAAPNPFSVEEIEAEFARLLGRPLDRKN